MTAVLGVSVSIHGDDLYVLGNAPVSAEVLNRHTLSVVEAPLIGLQIQHPQHHHLTGRNHTGLGVGGTEGEITEGLAGLGGDQIRAIQIVTALDGSVLGDLMLEVFGVTLVAVVDQSVIVEIELAAGVVVDLNEFKAVSGHVRGIAVGVSVFSLVVIPDLGDDPVGRSGLSRDLTVSRNGKGKRGQK